MVETPRSIPDTNVIVYGIELMGETPSADFTDTATPTVIIINPEK